MNDRSRRREQCTRGRGERAPLLFGGIWLIDGFLQLQPRHFSTDFTDDISANAMAQPRVISRLLIDVADHLAPHVATWNALFALIELALGVGIVVTSTRRRALVASVPWALAVWVIGEGVGNLATGFTMLPYGFPGAALLYAIVAIVLLVRDRGDGDDRAGTAAQKIDFGRVAWSVIWIGGAIAQGVPKLTPGLKYQANAQAAGDGEPGWLASLDHTTGVYLAHHALGATVVLALVETVIGLAPWLFPRSRSAFAAVVGVLVVFSILGENLGGVLSGSAYDVGAMPLFAVLAAMCWWRTPAVEAHRVRSELGSVAFSG